MPIFRSTSDGTIISYMSTGPPYLVAQERLHPPHERSSHGPHPGAPVPCSIFFGQPRVTIVSLGRTVLSIHRPDRLYVSQVSTFARTATYTAPNTIPVHV